MSYNRNRSPDRKSQKERIKELTEELEKGVVECYNSESFQTVIRTFSRFHNYSLNNCLLIALQAPGSTCVAGYVDWQKKFGRQVKKGEKGIKILAPCKYKVEIDDMDDPDADSSGTGSEKKQGTTFTGYP